MKLHRLRLRLQSGFITDWHSDTLFGSLCWIVAHRDGPDGLRRFLQPFIDGQPPFVLSDGFPSRLLPMPLHARHILDQLQLPEHEQAELAKKLKDNPWASPDVFDAVRRCDPEALRNALAQPPSPPPSAPQPLHPFISIGTLHARINRLTGTTAEEGSLYELREQMPSDNQITLYALVRDGALDTLQTLFLSLSKIGFGKKKSSGKGAFSLEAIEHADFPPIDRTDGFVILSHYVPAAADPTDGFYKVRIKFGRLGEHFALALNPFKRPLTMLEPGAVFRTPDGLPPKPFYGRIVPNVAPQRPEVVQCGYAIAVPLRHATQPPAPTTSAP